MARLCTCVCSDGEGDNHAFMKAYGHDLLQSFLAYGEGDYGRAVDLLYPIRHEAGHMGGSTLQVQWGCSDCPGDLLPDTQNCGLRMRRECRERFFHHRGLAIPTYITACMPGFLTSGFL